MKDLIRKLALLSALFFVCAPTGGCATIIGTAVSPVTGAVDLTKRYLSPVHMGGRGKPWAAPFVFLGGMLAGPFVAFYNGVIHDVSIFGDWNGYWREFPEVFEPFKMVGKVKL